MAILIIIKTPKIILILRILEDILNNKAYIKDSKRINQQIFLEKYLSLLMSVNN